MCAAAAGRLHVITKPEVGFRDRPPSASVCSRLDSTCESASRGREPRGFDAPSGIVLCRAEKQLEFKHAWRAYQLHTLPLRLRLSGFGVQLRRRVRLNEGEQRLARPVAAPAPASSAFLPSLRSRRLDLIRNGLLCALVVERNCALSRGHVSEARARRNRR
eukprot:8057561-Pyramimonas_sp.AAC.1